MINKKKIIRNEFRNIRDNICLERKKKAHKDLSLSLFSIIQDHQYVLSFASLEKEINLWEINKLLAKQKKLILPRVLINNQTSNHSLEFYKVTNIETDLEKSFFNIFEPKIILPKFKNLSSVTLAIIPGLAFDKYNNRLGYGMGFYDSILNKMKSAIKIGIGYKEQLFQSFLPTEKHDVVLNKVLLF